MNRWRGTTAPVRRGCRRFYPDLAITCTLTLREVYRQHYYYKNQVSGLGRFCQRLDHHF